MGSLLPSPHPFRKIAELAATGGKTMAGFTRHFRTLIVVALIGANVLVLALAAYSLSQSRQQYELRAQTLTQNIALAIDQNLSSTIAKVDLVLRNTVDELEHQLANGALDERAMDAFLVRQQERLPELEAVRVAAADGLVILGKGLNKQERPTWADRDYFIHLRDHRDAGLQMSVPRMGRVAKQYIVGFARRYNGPDGRFAGVVSAPVSLDRFNSLISRFDLGPKGTVVLRDGDLGLFTRHPPLPGEAIGTVGNNAVSRELRELAASGAAEASYYTAQSADQMERIVSFRRTNSSPMFVIAGMASDDYLGDWRKELYATSGLVAGFMALSSLSAAFLLALLKRVRHELTERRQLEDAERRRRASHQRLNEIAAHVHLPLSEQYHQALTIGAEHLGLEFGIASHIEGDIYQIVAQVSPPDTLHDGQTFPFGDTYCSITLEHNNVVAIAHMGSSPEKGHPCYQAFKLEAYIGAPIRVEGRVFGTVNFSSPHPYPRDFDEGDREFVALLARWIGSTIERDQAQKQLRASELRLKTIVETQPECVKIVAPDGALLDMNRAGLDMIEADSLEQVVGMPVFGVIAPASRDAFRALHEGVVGGESRMLEFEVVGLKGGHRWLETHAVPLRDEDGRITGHLGVTRDVTARRQTDAALVNAKQKAEAANVAKSRFLATMSHEIRTPMNGILGMAQLLLLPQLTEDERHEFATTILNSGKTLLTLLNDILDLSKVEAGKLDLSPAAMDPQQIIDETTALFAEPAQAKGLKIEAAWRGPEGQRYRVDPIRLRQMLSNLTSNAVKFTARGFVRLEASEIERQDDRALLEFSVTDSGIGIPPDKQSMLFKPFSQVDGSTTRGYGGTGLGLSIVDSFARLMGGDVGIESEAGKGARFWFRVWTDVVREDAAREAGEPLAVTGTAPASVLVVEDNLVNLKVIEAFLRKSGIHSQSVGNGKEAVDAVIGGLRPDIVLMDVQMPVMDGCAATEHIRQWEQAGDHPRLPIIALTAGAFKEDRQRCSAAGMDDFLAKPIDAKDLAAMLAKWTGPAEGACQ